MNRFIIVFCLLIFFSIFSCTSNYEAVEARIIKTEPPTEQRESFIASIEYFVDSVRYTDTFEVPFERMLEDSISTPAEGIVFPILVDPENPKNNKIEFNVKAVYMDAE